MLLPPRSFILYLGKINEGGGGMKRILCFGDSNTYGLDPDWERGENARFGEDTRWPCLLRTMLGAEYRIIEEGLCGRTTVFDNPAFPGRRGLDFLRPCIETHAPVDLAVIMLGGNDANSLYSASPADIAAGMGRLAASALDRGGYLIYGPPRVLIAAPSPLEGPAAESDPAAARKLPLLPKLYESQARRLGCEFIDLSHIRPSRLDGVHLDPDGHRAVAEALARRIGEIFAV